MKIAEIFGIDDGPLYEEIRRNILHINGADHRRLRGLVNPAFTPRAAERWRPAMRGFLEELCAASRTSGRCDAVEALCKPYPSLMIATVMGAPLEDAPRLHDWSNWIQRQFGTSVRRGARADRAGRRRVLRVRGRAARRRRARARRRPDLDADRRRAGGRPALRRRARQPRAQRAGRRRRHDAEPARARAAAVRRAPRAVGAARRASPSSRPRAVEEVAALRADHAVHRADRDRGRRVPRRRRSPRARSCSSCAFTGNRDRRTRARRLRHHRRARRGQAADVRRRHPLLPGREPRARGAAGGARLPRPAHARASRSTASREYGTIDGIYGLDALPIRWG